MRIGYGKVGRSMPLSLAGCGNLGGDVECAAVVGELARRHSKHEFVLVGRNSGELPTDVGLPSNVFNPWIGWGPELRRRLNAAGLNKGALTAETQPKVIEIFDDLTLDYMRDLDGYVLWVGQHGTTNAPVPSISFPGRMTKPHDWSIYYASFLFRGINAWRDVDPLNREEVYLNADARNRHKMRDLKWPLRHPVLTQFNFTNNLKHERYGDPRVPHTVRTTADGSRGTETWSEYASYENNPFVWKSQVANVYSRLEINGLRPNTPFGDLISYNDDWERIGHFGLFINEARALGVRPELARVNIFRDWVAPLDPCFAHGTWSAASTKKLGRTFTAAPWDEYYPRLHSVRATFTTPSSGSGWATAKPWEAFAAGTVCFFHPAYDTQDNILGDAPEDLRHWLRVRSPEELALRVKHLSTQSGQQDWAWLVRQQHLHFEKALADLTYMKMIEERLSI
jgi:hypothetical protein